MHGRLKLDEGRPPSPRRSSPGCGNPAPPSLGYRGLGEVGSADPPGAGAVGGGDRLVTFDIGYGSTELATVVDGRISAISLPIGAATVTAAHLHSDPPDPAELSAALSVIELHLDDVVREMPELAAAITDSTIVGLGAVRFVAEVELGVADGDEIDGCVLERDAAEELFRALATESHEDRAANPGLQPDHVGWIVGAMCILLEFMRRFAVDEIRVDARSPRRGRRLDRGADRLLAETDSGSGTMMVIRR